MEDFMVLMGESMMMEMECVTQIEYPRDRPDTMLVKTNDATYTVTVAVADRPSK